MEEFKILKISTYSSLFDVFVADTQVKFSKLQICFCLRSTLWRRSTLGRLTVLWFDFFARLKTVL